jgi:3-oxoacyl-[acyl-carrier-protein] synthase II
LLLVQIVVTGVGAITPLGIGAELSYQAMCKGTSGVSKLPSWADEYPAQLAGMVSFDAKAHLKSKDVSRNGRYSHFALVAAREAMKDSGLDAIKDKINKDRFGCIIGSGIGGVEWFEDSCNAFTASNGGISGLRKVNPFLIPALIANTASGVVAIDHDARGPNYCVTTACASGTHSIGSALKHMRDGEV